MRSYAVSLFGRDNTAVRQLEAFAGNIDAFNTLFPQEKVYLHLDNTGYFRGETIWFKAYVLRTDSMTYSNLSRVLYVELLNPIGEVVEKRKLYLENGRAHGDIKLKEPLLAGFYEIRAYTRYMTNWDKNTVFSRVVPVFLDTIKFLRTRIDLKSVESRFASYGEKASKQPGVTFYPEGGQRVRGIPGRVAFEVPGNVVEEFLSKGLLLSEKGDTLEQVETVRDGRGMFYCLSDSEKLSLVLTDKKGRSHSFPLPQPVDTGCVMTLNTLQGETVSAQVSASATLWGETMGVTLMHNGSVYSFDTISLGCNSSFIRYQREELPAGINQITLFDQKGRIYSERLFFIPPHSATDISEISINVANSGIKPYGKIRLEARSLPESTFSLSVQDADARTAGNPGGNVATWMLLSSDLKGFIADPEYYFESDDAGHRLAADLLTMVQGWRRYRWEVMSGMSPFVKKQPIEEKLYLDGQLKGGKKSASVDNVELTAVLYNDAAESFKGSVFTDKEGYYAFDIPDCNGRWTLLLSTKKEEEARKYRIKIDRQFAPENRELSRDEVKLPQPDTTSIVYLPLSGNPADTIVSIPMKKGDRMLGQAQVKAKRYDKNHTRMAYENEEKHQYWDCFYYDCDKYSEILLDNGEYIPDVVDWLCENKFFYDEIKKKRRRAYWFENGETHHSKYVLNKAWNAIAKEPSYSLDEIRSIYIDINPVVTNISTGSESFDSEDRNPIMIYAYKHHTYWRDAKGLRRTYFQAYNVPETFRMNDYSILPPEEDYRRTLYWNPNVTTDKEGKATIEIWNNSTCKSLIISAESVLKDGVPAVYRNK
ncbi:MAG: hypothetical protein RR280_05775 [Bacteroidaceae bacterium]